MSMQGALRRDLGGPVLNSLDLARNYFAHLTTGSDPLSLDGRVFAGLPNRHIPVDEIRDLLLTRTCPPETRDAVWAHLVGLARREGAIWTGAAVGVAMPALTAAAARLSSRSASDRLDVPAEVLRGFLDALIVVDVSRPRIMLRLRWAAYRSGHRALSDDLSRPCPIGTGTRAVARHAPYGHPDLVLARAVACGVLTQMEAELIGATRLEEASVAEWAAGHQAGTWAVYKARKRAELRLAGYLRDEAADHCPAS